MCFVRLSPPRTVFVVVGAPRQSYERNHVYIIRTHTLVMVIAWAVVRRRNVFDDASHTASVDRVKIINFNRYFVKKRFTPNTRLRLTAVQRRWLYEQNRLFVLSVIRHTTRLYLYRSDG